MADKAITSLTAGGALAGTEQVHAVVGGNSRRFYLPAWQLAGSGYTSTGVWDQSVDGSVSAVQFTDLAGAQDIMVIVEDIQKSVSGIPILHVSTDNGSTYRSTSGDYESVSDDGSVSAAGGLGMHLTNATAARTCSVLIRNANVSGIPKIIESLNLDSPRVRIFLQSTNPINAFEIIPSNAGNFTGGKVYCIALGLSTT